MAGEWRDTTIGDFAPFSYGKGLPQRKRDELGKVPVYGSNGIVGHHDQPLLEGPVVIIGRKGTIGAVHYSDGPCWPIDTTFYVTEDQGRNLLFTYYLLKSLGLDRFNFDSAVPGLNRETGHSRRIRVPPILEQRAIAHILGTLDDKIELNRKMNETLEAMAQAIFKSWFVDFDPVIDNALAAGNPIPPSLEEKAARRKAVLEKAKAEGTPAGTPEHIAHLFPDEFEESELGAKPRGWEMRELLELINLIGGGTPKTGVAEYWGGDISWFSVVDAPREKDVFVIDTQKHITQLGVDNSSTKILRKGTTIISARGTVGKCALVGRPMAMNQSCYGIQGKDGGNDYFIYFTIRHQVIDLQRSGHGSVFNTITRDTFKSIRLASLPPQLMSSFDTTVQPIMELILARLKEIAILATIRDALLPKLISGELRVPDAEKFLEGIA